MKKILLLVIFPTISFCQLTVNSFPKNLQLFHRDKNNTCPINISGNLIDQTVEKLVLQVFKNDTLWKVEDATISNFSVDFLINAELTEYSFKIFKVSGGNFTLIKEATKVLCGEAILLYGQSNMVAISGIDEFNSNFSDKFMRNYDFSGSSDSTTWYTAKFPYAGVGTIGNYTMLNLIDSLKIPFCTINSSMGGAQLSHLSQRNPSDHFDTQYQYGKMLTRLKKSGLLSKIKYMGFFQGEAAAGNWYADCNIYPSDFDILFNRIAEDIPSIEKFYEFQINILTTNYVERAGYLRDFQRRTYDIYPNKIELISTVGTIPFDGIHFSNNSYQGMAKEFSELILRDFHGIIKSPEIDAPNIQYAFYNTAKDSIFLVFQENQIMNFPADIDYGNYIRRMKDFIYLTSDNQNIYYNQYNTPVENGIASGNIIKLKLNSQQNHLYITYLPASFPDNINPTYNGPHISNSKGLRALSFYCLPILNSPPNPFGIPSPPRNLVANGISSSQINISWKDNSSNEDYFILESSENGNDFSVLTTLDHNYFSDINKVINTPYFYRAKACNSFGCSAYSNTYTGVTFFQECSNISLSGSNSGIDKIYSEESISANSINQNSNLIFNASKFILLLPNFSYTPEMAKTFSAKIQGCN